MVILTSLKFLDMDHAFFSLFSFAPPLPQTLSFYPVAFMPRNFGFNVRRCLFRFCRGSRRFTFSGQVEWRGPSPETALSQGSFAVLTRLALPVVLPCVSVCFPELSSLAWCDRWGILSSHLCLLNT